MSKLVNTFSATENLEYFVTFYLIDQSNQLQVEWNYFQIFQVKGQQNYQTFCTNIAIINWFRSVFLTLFFGTNFAWFS